VLQALSWTFYLLLQHPEVEQKLLDEIREVLGTPEGSNEKDNSADADSSSGGVMRPCYDQLRRLRYGRAVFMEALRLYPSVPEVGNMTQCGMYTLLLCCSVTCRPLLLTRLKCSSQQKG
jgi:cytochrome P450